MVGPIIYVRGENIAQGTMKTFP